MERMKTEKRNVDSKLKEVIAWEVIFNGFSFHLLYRLSTFSIGFVKDNHS